MREIFMSLSKRGPGNSYFPGPHPCVSQGAEPADGRGRRPWIGLLEFMAGPSGPEVRTVRVAE